MDESNLTIEKWSSDAIIYWYRINDGLLLQINYFSSYRDIWLHDEFHRKIYEYPSHFFNKYEDIIDEIDRMHCS